MDPEQCSFSKIQSVSIVQRLGLGSHVGFGSTWDSIPDRCTSDSIRTCVPDVGLDTHLGSDAGWTRFARGIWMHVGFETHVGFGSTLDSIRMWNSGACWMRCACGIQIQVGLVSRMGFACGIRVKGRLDSDVGSIHMKHA